MADNKLYEVLGVSKSSSDAEIKKVSLICSYKLGSCRPLTSICLKIFIPQIVLQFANSGFLAKTHSTMVVVCSMRCHANII